MAAKGALQPLLKYLRVPVQPLRQNIFSLTPHLFRSFSSEEVRGCFLDKSEVTDRVISVVKNFQKVDPSKVTMLANKPLSECGEISYSELDGIVGLKSDSLIS